MGTLGNPTWSACPFDRGEPMTLLDVRQKAQVDLDPRALPGARWLSPDEAARRGEELPRDREAIALLPVLFSSCYHGGSESLLSRLKLIPRKSLHQSGGPRNFPVE